MVSCCCASAGSPRQGPSSQDELPFPFLFFFFSHWSSKKALTRQQTGNSVLAQMEGKENHHPDTTPYDFCPLGQSCHHAEDIPRAGAVLTLRKRLSPSWLRGRAARAASLHAAGWGAAALQPCHKEGAGKHKALHGAVL